MEDYNTSSTQEKRYPPISVGDWVLTLLILAIPLVNLIMLFVWAFGGNTHPSKESFAKASLIWMAIGIALGIIFLAIAFGLGLMASWAHI